MRNKVINLTAGAFFIIYFIFNVYLLPHYGLSWDEPVHYQRGQVYLQYFLTKDQNNFDSKASRLSIYQNLEKGFVKDNEVANFPFWIKNDDGHPPLNGILATVSNRIFYQNLGFLGDIEGYHLFIVAVSVFLGALVFYWTKSEYGIFAGIVSFLSLVLYPLFFAESHFNIKDPVEASFYAVTLLLFYKGVKNNSFKYIIVSSILGGLALSTKFNILFAFFGIVPWIVIYKWNSLKRLKWPFSLSMSRALLAYLFITFGILYATWPFLWQNPINNLIKIFSYYKEIGSTIDYQPQSYLLFGKINTFASQWILFTTPIVILSLSLIGIFYSLRKGFKEKNKTALFILLWFLVPIIRVSTPNAGIYGGVRQVMEFIPAMAILSGIGAKYMVTWLHGYIVKHRPFNHLAICFAARRIQLFQLLVILSFLPIALKLISIHPNENVYFNPLIGGLEGAKEKNIMYWGYNLGNVFRQAAVWLNQNAEENNRATRGTAFEDIIQNVWLRKDIKYSHDYQSGFEKKGEYVIELTHDMPAWSYFYYFNYAKNSLKPMYEIKVDGVPILTIWKNDWENTKDEFKKEDKKITVNNYKKENNSILIDIGEEILLKEVDIFFGDPSCIFTDEGYFVTADKDQKWTNHPGDLGEIAFYKNFNPRSNKGALSYLFPLLKTKIVKVIYSQKNTCLENIKEIEISGI